MWIQFQDDWPTMLREVGHYIADDVILSETVIFIRDRNANLGSSTYAYYCQVSLYVIKGWCVLWDMVELRMDLRRDR